MPQKCIGKLPTILLVLASCLPLLQTEYCYQSKKVLHFAGDFAEHWVKNRKECPPSPKPAGCYEWSSKAPGRIEYRAGCNASECPASTGFDAKLHTCLRCRDKSVGALAAAKDGVCETVGIRQPMVGYLLIKCPYLVQGVVVEGGSNATAKSDSGVVFCKADKKCGTARWFSANLGMETNYTGCISDCNRELQLASGSASGNASVNVSKVCTECSLADCAKKLPTVAEDVPGPELAPAPKAVRDPPRNFQGEARKPKAGPRILAEAATVTGLACAAVLLCAAKLHQ